jgi:hypothetical protein
VAEESIVSFEGIEQTGDIDELKALVKRRRQLDDSLRKADAAEKRVVDRAAQRKKLVTAAPLEERKALDLRLTKLLITRKRRFWAAFGKVIKLPDGEVRYRLDDKSLDTPKSTAAIIAFLLTRRGGKDFITFKPSLNRDAITQAGESLHRSLKPFGAWVGKHSFITVKTKGEQDPTILDRRRYREVKK